MISGMLVILLSLLFDLSQIAAIGSISVLLVHGITHVGHLRKLDETGASFALVLVAATVSIGAMLLALVYVSQTSNTVLPTLAVFVGLAFVIEVALQQLLGRTVKPRLSTANNES